MTTLTVLGLSSVFLLFWSTSAQDINFPDEDDSHTYVSGSAQVTERKPVNVPHQCPDNMLLYPGDGPKSSWICDCKPLFLYFPTDDSCHEAFFRGPCPSQHYAYLAPNEAVPSCAKNSCMEDGYVPYKGACHRLRSKGGPCGPDGFLGVNETTFQLECIEVDLVPFHFIDVRMQPCPPGSRRTSLKICKPEL